MGKKLDKECINKIDNKLDNISSNIRELQILTVIIGAINDNSDKLLPYLQQIKRDVNYIMREIKEEK